MRVRILQSLLHLLHSDGEAALGASSVALGHLNDLLVSLAGHVSALRQQVVSNCSFRSSNSHSALPASEHTHASKSGQRKHDFPSQFLAQKKWLLVSECSRHSI